MFSSASAVLHSPSAHKRLGLDSLPATNNIHGVTNTIRMKIKSAKILSTAEKKKEIYLLSLVIDDVSNNPFSLNALALNNISCNEEIPLGETGLEIYSNDNGIIPGYIHFRVCVMESNLPDRDFQKLLTKIMKQTELAQYAGMLNSVTPNAVADLKIFTQVAEQTLQFMGKIIKSEKDIQLLQVIGSYDNAFDALGYKYGLTELGNKNAAIKMAVEVS